MKILIATDAWSPQINGVVRTLQTTIGCLRKENHEVHVIHPELWKTYPVPGYPEIRIPISMPGIDKFIELFDPDAIHIATEGRVGWKVRNFCARHNHPFTTAYHTHFPMYLKKIHGVPESWSWKVIKKFHTKSQAVMVSTQTMIEVMEEQGIKNAVLWGRGVDTEIFRHRDLDTLGFERPIFLNVGRVSKEKGLPDFLSLELPGTKVVVGDGPMLSKYQEAYPSVKFLGAKSGQELGEIYSQSDVFVFPSKTDTFGLVMAEAIMSGVPVAAYPVPGPIDVVQDKVTGILDDDIKTACLKALELGRLKPDCADFSWEAATKQFLVNLRPLDSYTKSLHS